MDEKMRAEFEVAAKTAQGLDVTRLPHGGYRSFATHQAWWAWQASRAALVVVSLSDYEALKSEHDALKHAVSRLMEHDFAEDCQECGIGQSDAWAEVKTIIAGTGVRVKP